MKKTKKVLINKKVQIATACGAVVIAGILLFQGVIPKTESTVKINSITPNQGPAGMEVVISGSGFSSSIQGIIGTQINGKVYAPGNYILIQSDVLDQPILSPDGKTLTFHVNLISEKVKMDCAEVLSRIKPGSCKIQIKVVNAYGKMSLGQYFTITSSGSKILTYTIEKLDMPMSPVVHAVVPGQSWNGDDVMRFRVSASATNEQTITGILLAMAPYANTVGDTPVPCSYFYYMNPLTGSPTNSGGAWEGIRMIDMANPGGIGWGGTIGVDGGIFSWAPEPYNMPIGSMGCPAYTGGFPLAPGEHKDFVIHMKMYAQGYSNQAPFTPLAEQSKTFGLMVRASALYNGPGTYVIDNSPDNGYVSSSTYIGAGGVSFNKSLSTLIISDPIQIIPQSIPTPAEYFPAP
ncbi:MAG: hypothetical protein V1745_02665 [Patescibacteria group bacterium]